MCVLIAVYSNTGEEELDAAGVTHMPVDESVTIPLTDVVGSVLDASSGVTATSILPILDNRAALIGTDKGSVLLCTLAGREPRDTFVDVLTPNADITLHCGPVHDLALSSQHLVATAGHDAVVCVFSLHVVFTEAGLSRCRRLTGHVVPVVAVRFLSDGTTLASLSADGHVRLVDAVAGDVVAVLSLGFAATCLACSLDETMLFVGGRCLAAVDLCGAVRPASLQSAAEAMEVWGPVAANNADISNSGARAAATQASAGMRLFQWAPQAPSMEEENLRHLVDQGKVAHVSKTPRGTVITKLLVGRDDSALAAVFACSTAGGVAGLQPCGEARWSAKGGRTADYTRWWTADSGTSLSDLLKMPSQRHAHDRHAGLRAVSVRCRVKAAARPSVKQPHSSSSNATNAAAALWHGRWYASPFELSGTAGVSFLAAESLTMGATCLSRQDGASDVLAYPLSGARTPGEEEALVEAQCDELQRVCDALVFEIRALRAAKEEKQAASYKDN